MTDKLKLTPEGDLYVTEEIDERLPAVTDGLVAHFPFDGTEKGIDFNPILDYSIWEDGQTGSIGIFGQYSDGNSRVMGTDPWGKPIVVWKSSNSTSTTYPSQGGIYCSSVPIDNTKMYRMSWWQKRVTNNNGTYGNHYVGLNGYGSVNGVGNLTNTTPNTNPYFWSTNLNGLPINEWVLIVGHIFPHTHTGTTRHEDSGRYTVKGFLGNTSADYKWLPETTTARSRTIAIYRGNVPDMIHHTCYPRIDICDGTEPSIEDLLTGEGNVINSSNDQNLTILNTGVSVEQATINLADTSLNALGEITSSDNGWTNFYDDGSGYPTIQTPLGYRQVAYKAWKTEGGTSGGIWFGRTQPETFLTISPSTVYTASYYINVKERDYFHANFIYLRQYRADMSSVSNGGVANISNRTDLGNGWYRIWATFTTSSETHRIRLDHYAYDSSGNAVMFFGGQLEQKPFLTRFTETSRVGDGILLLDNNLISLNEGTISTWFKPSSGFFSTNSWNRVFGIATSTNINEIQVKRNNTGNNLVMSISNSSGSPQTSWSSCPSSNIEANRWHHVVARWSKNNSRMSLTVNNIKNEQSWTSSHYPTTLGNFAIGYHPNTTRWSNSEFKNLSIYNRELTDLEVSMISNNSVALKDINFITPTIEESPFEWKMIFHGLATQSINESLSDGEYYNNYISDFQRGIKFNQMRITSPFWDQDVVATTTEMAQLNYSFKWYVQWLYAQADGTSPKIKFHDLDGNQDVGFTNTTAMLFGYGNSWRRITPIYYVDGSSMYHGQVPSYIHYTDWGGLYNSTMLNDSPREGGTFNLTPREYQEMIVWVRINPEVDEYKMRLSSDTLQIQNQIIET